MIFILSNYFFENLTKKKKQKNEFSILFLYDLEKIGY
jgi:hypothetical protein